MPSVNERLVDLTVRHHVGVQRLSSGLLKRLIKILDQSDNEIVNTLLDRPSTLEGTFTSRRLRYLLDAIREINHDAHVSLGQSLRDELVDAAKYEVEFQKGLLSDAIGVELDVVSPSVSQLRAILTSKPFDGHLLSERVQSLETGKLKLLRQAVQLGITQGETSEQIVRRVRGTRARNYRDGALNLPRVATERLVRTAVNHISNAAREELFAENDDLVDEVQWIATLDTRTCPRCMALDGKTFGLKQGPRPPLHLNCRCTIAPVLKSWRALGIDADEVPLTTRASMNGQVSATDTFNSWLRKQKAAVQDEALGKTRGALFRRGGLSVDRFVDVRGNELTLDELRDRETSAFRKAGVA